jgi:hypothetical protein
MLRTNLATRPFYNERAVYLVLGVLAFAGLAILASLALRVMDLSGRNTELAARAEQAERQRDDLSMRITEVQGAVSTVALEEIALAAREANTLIDQRVFSWAQFFNRIETTLPPDVMVTLVRPDITPESVEVTMGVVGRDLDAITYFIGSLEDSGAFSGLLNQSAELTDAGMYQAVLRGRYLQSGIGPSDAEQPREADGSATLARVNDTGLSESTLGGENEDVAGAVGPSGAGRAQLPPGNGDRP